jgi:hypothetical protein
MENKLMSDSIDQLATALAKAQGEMSTAGKNQKNPFFKSSYADFEAIVSASRPSLAKYGLSVVQAPVFSEETGQSFLISMLMHNSGQWIQSKALHNPQKNDIQSLSSYNTYLKRMCYTSLVGVVTGEDDDGEGAVVREHPKYEQGSTIITGYQHAYLMTLVNQIDPNKEKIICDFYKIDNLTKLPASEYAKVIEQLKGQLPKKD